MILFYFFAYIFLEYPVCLYLYLGTEDIFFFLCFYDRNISLPRQGSRIIFFFNYERGRDGWVHE